MSDGAAGRIRRKRGKRSYCGQLDGAIRIVSTAPVLIKTQSEHKVRFEPIIDRVEDAREWHVSDQRNFQACEEPTWSLFGYNLSKRVDCARIF